jgi:hypothetical protein
LQPLVWLLVLLLTGMLSSISLKGPDWLIRLLAGFVVLVIFVYLYSYLHCLRDPRKIDALRSEHYGIQKMAVERQLLGDDTTGIFTVDIDSEKSLIPPSNESAQRELSAPTTIRVTPETEG